MLLADATVTDEPLAVNVPLRIELEPFVTLPKFSEVGVNVSCPAGAPVPASAMLSCVSDAFERIDNVPETVPEDVGEYTTLNVMLWPAPSVVGGTRPFTPKAALDILAWEIVTLPVPEFESVSVND